MQLFVRDDVCVSLLFMYLHVYIHVCIWTKKFSILSTHRRVIPPVSVWGLSVRFSFQPDYDVPKTGRLDLNLYPTDLKPWTSQCPCFSRFISVRVTDFVRKLSQEVNKLLSKLFISFGDFTGTGIRCL